MKRFITRAAAGLVLTAALAGGAGAATVSVSDAEFETRIDAAGRSLALAGTGVAKYRVVFTVYAAAFYAPAGTAADQVLAADTPRHLEIEYFYEIAPEDIIRASMTVLERQLSSEELAALRDRLDRWHGSYRKVAEGDRYAMIYVPGEGTTLRFNGEPLITVEGADFARAYFGIWLGEDPLSEGLREDLIARLETSP